MLPAAQDNAKLIELGKTRDSLYCYDKESLITNDKVQSNVGRARTQTLEIVLKFRHCFQLLLLPTEVMI